MPVLLSQNRKNREVKWFSWNHLANVCQSQDFNSKWSSRRPYVVILWEVLCPLGFDYRVNTVTWLLFWFLTCLTHPVRYIIIALYFKFQLFLVNSIIYIYMIYDYKIIFIQLFRLRPQCLFQMRKNTVFKKVMDMG